jgi:hypothetical protein
MVCYMYTATTTIALDYKGLMSVISKGNARGKQVIYIERTTTLLKALFFSP